MTGQDLVDNALENLGVSVGNLGFSTTDAFTAWALRRVNRAVLRLYYYTRSTMKQQRRYVTREVHDFRAFSEDDYPEGQQDLSLFAREEQIVDIRVKYSAEQENYRLAEAFDSAVSSISEREWARNASELAPRFTVDGIAVKIFPKPQATVTNGIVIRKAAQVRSLNTLGQDIESVVPDMQWVLIPLMEKAVYERLKNTEGAAAKEGEYRGLLRDIRAQFAGRVGENVQQPVPRPLYI